MSIINKVAGKLFGSKSDRDLKELQPYIGRINVETERVEKMSNDELREVAAKLGESIRGTVAGEKEEIVGLKSQLEDPQMDVEEKEKIYHNIERIEKDIDDKLAGALDEGIPLAFAIIKETARRFKENDYLEVTASDYDKDLAAERDSIEIKGDKARWMNTWMAGGTMITWDMIHYDVQLIGGVVLHEGRIAEMATGEGKTVVATLPVFLNALMDRLEAMLLAL